MSGRLVIGLRCVLAALLVLPVLVAPSLAVQPNEVLKDPKLEQRARALSAELRCLVCQNQSIDDSNAPLARDLRLLVRERLTAGDSDADVLDFIVSRYGEFVLLRPPFGWHTLLLWLAPLLVLLMGIMLARIVVGRRQQGVAHAATAMGELSQDEKDRLRRLLNDDGVT